MKTSLWQTAGAFRIGHGYDIHRLKRGGTLMLGGVAVSRSISPVAHSDGDVVFHALVDAILGALGLGDIGQHFPNSDRKWKNARSAVFVKHAVRLASEAGFHVANVDSTILLEQPKLARFRKRMRASLQSLVGSAATVNIKAGTNEGCDAVGRGEAVAAHVVVLLTAKS